MSAKAAHTGIMPLTSPLRDPARMAIIGRSSRPQAFR